ncbi:E3 ubiquitin-protein ligase ZNF598 isoform X2 [Selaginella moellendorffii]|uniref:E3 ubiquitin-protein ligase ZNF598 isoform X2 n=1 Tax=Selaginella moellendorffii TaxID=88036 RepID=UPI000D1C4B27|nr:E3 ubiquitin-protein ligase ZNF598 isoform X2 [Selaginella moellendorffii]|eukprot:XP_024531658.1 E3 ubiquitin-protein ligase ZNF598 isoform X2 [Selaginella moellendorffii]
MELEIALEADMEEHPFTVNGIRVYHQTRFVLLVESRLGFDRGFLGSRSASASASSSPLHQSVVLLQALRFRCSEMEDCCAVCAEPLEWIAYGGCGHREVCATCTARLRVVLDDKRCCICKQECPFVFVTKALGDYTKVVSDFSSLSTGHQSGNLWFEADIGAYFDDEDEYKRIKAMCRLQCKVCEAATAATPPVNGAVRAGHVFRNLDTLRRHIFSAHRLIMCSLCLEGRKVFIQDQKLYTKPQLERHSSRGDSVVDGNEEERGGFTGHPMCAFCTRRFYSDNELYHHMSTEHFTCHLCQRLRPGQFDYYENYDDLESHFRNEHALCEDPDCLAKKFVVFASEQELKVHNAKEHGGSLTRAQRNAALKIPVSYQFRRSPGQQASERGRSSYYRGNRGNDLNAELLSSPPRETVVPLASEDTDTSAVANNPAHFPALAPSESVAASASTRENTDSARWYRTALHGGGRSSLNESAFPPLPGAAQPQHSRQQSQRPLASLIAAGGAGGKKVKVLNAKQRAVPETRPPESRAIITLNPSEYPELQAGHSSSALAGRGPPLGGPGAGAGGGGGGPSHSSSSSAVVRPASADVVQLSMDEIRAATKVLIEEIRSHLKGNEDEFAKFKEVHSQFRSGELSAKSYYDQVAKLGLSNILPELARLCPDRRKQEELLDVMKQVRAAAAAAAAAEKPRNGYRDPSGDGAARRREKQAAVEEDVEVLSTDGYRRKGGSGTSSSFLALPSSFPSLSSSSSPSLSVLYKAKAEAPPGTSDWSCETCTLVNPWSSVHCAACGAGKPLHQPGGNSSSGNDVIKEAVDTKKKKKVPKFLRNRLGSDVEEEETSATSAVEEVPAGATTASTTRGAWRNGGGHRLLAVTSSSSQSNQVG